MLAIGNSHFPKISGRNSENRISESFVQKFHFQKLYHDASVE